MKAADCDSSSKPLEQGGTPDPPSARQSDCEGSVRKVHVPRESFASARRLDLKAILDQIARSENQLPKVQCVVGNCVAWREPSKGFAPSHECLRVGKPRAEAVTLWREAQQGAEFRVALHDFDVAVFFAQHDRKTVSSLGGV